MDRFFLVFLTLLVVSCSTTNIKENNKKPIFEVLKTESDGGAQIQFCEVLSELEEIKLLLNDKKIKNKIKPTDIKTANFLILNMGEKPTGGYYITVERAEERADSIVVYVKNMVPKANQKVTQAFTYPYCVVKINSKKGIILN